MNEERKNLIIKGNGKEVAEEIKTYLNLNEGDEVELYFKANKYVIIQKTAPICFVCGAKENLYPMGNKIILCKECLKSVCSAMFEKVPKEKFKEVEKRL